MTLIQLKDNNHLVRDTSNSGIINTSLEQYNNYLKAKQLKEQELCKIDSIENDIQCLKNDLCEIKQLLLNFKNDTK